MKPSSCKKVTSTIQRNTKTESGERKMDEHIQDDDSPISLRALRTELHAHREAVIKDIKSQIENLHLEVQKNREEMKEDMRALREEIFPELAALHKAQAESASECTGMGKALSDTMDRVAALEQSHEVMTKEHKKMHEKCMDLENRSRRQNLRFVGVPEGVEAGNPIRFIKDLLLELFGADDLGDSSMIVDRAHRTLAPKPKPGERPRAIIARFHYYSDKEKILKLSRNKGRLYYKGSPVHIFPDVSPEVGKLRAAFNPVKAKLRAAGINYSLFYPAKLAITMDGIRYTFEHPREAEKFIEKKIQA